MIKKILVTLPFAISLSAFAANNQGGAGSLNQAPVVNPPSGGAQTNGSDLNTGAVPVPGGTYSGTMNRPSGPSNPATEMQRSTMTEITFAKGQTDLGTEAKQRLDQFMNEARRRGEIDQVRVLSWGDVTYPNKKQEVPKAQKSLADKRGESVEGYLEKTNNLQVKTYNMTERPTAIEELLNSSEARTKDGLERAGLTKPGSDRSSRSMVMVIVK